MPRYKISGIYVSFPFKAYDCQIDYMRKVIDALEGKANALLESPTGTGKTLCLLCASLGWLRSKKKKNRRKKTKEATNADGSSEDDDNDNDDGVEEDDEGDGDPSTTSRTIVYSSRTHSQLAKIVKELRSTTYRPKTCVLGSRKQMCIHKDVSKLSGTAQIQACRSLVGKQECSAHNRVQPWLAENKKAATELLDIEDLVKIGRSGGGCPFYISKELQTDAELVILPYNYMVDPKIRKTMTSFDWERCTLIFDEAHNLERVCTDAASFDLPSVKLSQCISEVQSAIEHKLQAAGNVYSESLGADESDVEAFRVTKAILCNLEKVIASHAFPPSGEGLTFPGDYIFKLLAKVEITPDNFHLFAEQLQNVLQALGERDEQMGIGRKAYVISVLQDAIKIVERSMGTLSENDPPMFEGYRVHIAEKPKETGPNLKRSANPMTTAFKRMPTLSFWCFLPGIAMRELVKLGVESIIVTSGTLAPLASFSHELQLPFKESIENPHVIAPSQVWLGVLPVGPSNVRLNSSYKSRNLPEYKKDLGNAIANFARVVPDGLLVFFPSFVVMNTCVQSWQTPLGGSGVCVWDHITRHKQAIIEPRESKLFAQASEDFRAKLDDPHYSGAIFFGVCRGKASEGLDFSDRAGRAVIVTGIPYAMKTDPQVRIKKEVLDQECRKKKPGNGGPSLVKLTGDAWYRQQASRAVNQALGRVIRHKDDYGAIILLDERFRQRDVRKDLSKWLQPHVREFETFGAAAGALTKFFRNKRTITVQVEGSPARMPGGQARAKEGVHGGGVREAGSGGGFQVVREGEGVGGMGGKGQPRQQLPASLGARFDLTGLSTFASKFAGGNGKDANGKAAGRGGGSRKQSLSEVLAASKKRKAAMSPPPPIAPQSVSIRPRPLIALKNQNPPPANRVAPPADKIQSASAPAKQFLLLAKSLYSKDDYKKFSKLFASYKHTRISISDLIGELKRMGQYDQMPLMRALEQFVFTKDVPLYRELIGGGDRGA